ncbi:hypothetical protein QJQ45_000586 [Haematococcus lacustris]|nr:hypothetical protein QJQ45_000586 [Haematococcus lacustris]
MTRGRKRLLEGEEAGVAQPAQPAIQQLQQEPQPQLVLEQPLPPPPLPVHPLHAVNMTEQLLAAYAADEDFASTVDQYDQDKHGLYRTKGKNQIVVPNCQQLKARILVEMHDAQFAGHVGITKTLERISRIFWWPRMRSESDWPFFLSLAEFAVNNSWQESIQSTPFLVNTGQSPLTPALLELPGEVYCPSARKLSEWWQSNVKQARHFMEQAQQRQAYLANKGRREVEFSPGQLVLLSTKNLRLKPGKAKKLLPRFIGPFKVLEHVGPVAVRLDLPPAMARMHPVFHVALLRPYTRALTAAPILPETGTSAAAAQADEIQRLRQQLVGANANLQASQNEAVRVRAELAEMERLQGLVNATVSGEPAVAAIRNQYSQSARPAVNGSSGISAALVAPVAPALSGTATPVAPTAPPAAPAGHLPLSQAAMPVTVPASLPRIKVPGPDKWTDQCLATSRVAEIFCEDLEVHCAYLRIDPADALPNFLSGKAREEMAGDDLRNESDMHRRKLLDPGALRMSAGSTLNSYITEFRNTLTVAGATCMAPSMLVATFIRGLTPELQSRVVHDLALMPDPKLTDAIQAAVNAQKVLFAVCLRREWGPLPGLWVGVKPKLLEKATARRTAHHVMAKKKRKGSDKKQKASRSRQGKQRQESRDGWTTRRRQVIKVPEGAVLCGCKKTRRKLREHLRLRAEIHSQLRVIACLPASMECDTDSDSESDCNSEPEPQSDSESESEPEPVRQPPPRRCSARLAALAPAAPTGPPLPLDCEDPAMLRQLKDFCKFFANPNYKTCYNQLQRRHVRHRHPMLMPAFEDPSNQALLAKLHDLGSIYLAAPTGPTQQPGSHTDSSLRARAQHSPASQAQQAHQEPAAEPTKGKGKGKAAKAKPAPQPGRWVDRDCNAALNMQRIGESKWRPLELCYWPDQGALPAKGKEYPGLGYKRLRDKPPKAQQQQQQPAEAQ